MLTCTRCWWGILRPTSAVRDDQGLALHWWCVEPGEYVEPYLG